MFVRRVGMERSPKMAERLREVRVWARDWDVIVGVMWDGEV
jgi:hypothetical protein